MAFLGRRPNRPGHVLLAGVLYALGGSLTYVRAGRRGPEGRRLRLAGLALATLRDRGPGADPHPAGNAPAGADPVAAVGRDAGRRFQNRAERGGLWMALPLGVLLALGFCPASAAFFFGSLLWMAARHDSWRLLPLAYGLGAAPPVVVAACVLAFSAQLIGRVFAVTALVARWAQRIAGTVLIVGGVYFAVRFIF